MDLWAGWEVGDPARRVFGRAVAGSVLLASLLFAFVAVGKELPALYAHEPWQDDPYDALVSFELLALPALIGLSALRLLLCRADEPLPARRVVDLLRMSRVLIWLGGVTVTSLWLSVLAGDHRSAWTPVTAGLLTGLAALTVLTGAGARLVGRARRAARDRGDAPERPDWLSDALVLAQRLTERVLGEVPASRRLLERVDSVVVAAVRRHPLGAAAAGSLVAAAVTDAPQVMLEQYRPAFAAYFAGVTACGLFAFTVVAGAYLHIVGRSGRSRSAAGYAFVLACASVPITAAFRDSLWWLVGTDERHGDLPALLALTAVVAGATALVTVLVLRLGHREPA